jgi:hypothetical protein
MLYRQRSQMRVRDEIAMYARQREKVAEQLRVPFCRLRYPYRFASEPFTDLPPRIANRFGMVEHARIQA